VITRPWFELGGGNAGYPQSFDEPIDEAHIIAEEEFLSRRFDVVVRLALQQFRGRCFRLRPIPEKSERRRKCRKSLVGGVGLPRRPSREFDRDVILAKGEVRP